MQNDTSVTQVDQNAKADTITVGGEEHRITYHIHPLKPIRARNPRLSVRIVETVKGLAFPHIVQGCYEGGMPFKYTVDERGYRYANRKPSDFDIENTTRPNSFETAAADEVEATTPSPVPAPGDESGWD